MGCMLMCSCVLQEEEGICTSKLFTEKGMIGLLEQAASLFKLVGDPLLPQ